MPSTLEVRPCPALSPPGLDGSRESLAAAARAVREALRRGLRLRLLHVWGLAVLAPEPFVRTESQRYWSEPIPREALTDCGTPRYPGFGQQVRLEGGVPRPRPESRGEQLRRLSDPAKAGAATRRFASA
ncbi:universal stress protein [Streptomyces sp. 7N604]|uniref:universal stress protein n=1 Tax=Streptomyces sp. 7N604 TaxID=3457415 RepID=UPI003FD47D88